jgi:hypothetical protein
MGAEKKEWWATGDDRTRDSHLAAWQAYSEGGNPGPILINQFFEVGSSRLMQPGDPSGPPEETIQCLAPWSLVLAPDVVAASRVFYEGPMIELTVSGGDKLTVTPNHPILTVNGFVAAKLFSEGDNVVCCIGSQEVAKTIYKDDNHVPTAIEDIWGALVVSGAKRHTSYLKVVVPHDFYGDGRFMNGYINIIGADSFLEGEVVDTALNEHVTEDEFNRGCSGQFFFSAFSPSAKLVKGPGTTFNSRMGSSRQVKPFLGRHALHTQAVGLTNATALNTSLNEITLKDGARYTSLAREFLLRFTSLITEKKLIKVREFSFSDHVYDLQTFSQLYTSNGFLVKNCRCTILPFMDTWAGTEAEVAEARAAMDAEVARREAEAAESEAEQEGGE